ncbi:ubiquinol-cytochrome C reductase complex, 6.4kD protein [Ditylenchus destructor]|nr:ubiquinol-cytochrome C reductase complex, 6.4kD protein [Ditylenchus destructor]
MPLVTLTVIVKKTYKHLPTFKRMALNPNYYPTYGALAVGGALSLVYFTDWKVVAKRIPFWNERFPEEE